MEDTKDDLASLRIDRDRPARSPWRWPLLLLVPGLLLLGGLYGLRARAALSGTEVETVQGLGAAARRRPRRARRS